MNTIERDVLAAATRMLELARSLGERMQQIYPEISDDPWLTLIPKKGTLEVDKRAWKFKKHGTGFEFVDSNEGVIINVDRFVSNPYSFDKWMLIRYLGSTMPEKSESYWCSESEMDESLTRLAAGGQIWKSDSVPATYSLEEPA